MACLGKEAMRVWEKHDKGKRLRSDQISYQPEMMRLLSSFVLNIAG